MPLQIVSTKQPKVHLALTVSCPEIDYLLCAFVNFGQKEFTILHQPHG